ncbi:MAG TPA: DUF4389 domain-containing protein [Solirubrobacteraceae bacterium]|nr:DUF4389 domain-containing protein [Solirubrobacteraceae bacterium]
MNDRPVQLIVSGDLQRSRATVFFRLILVIPLVVWLALWGLAATIAVIVNWFATLIQGQSPQSLHDFIAAYVRFAIHLYAYLLLAAEPYPDFLGKPGYPVDVRIAPPAPQNRWKVGFRIVLAIPALLIAGALTSGRASGYGYNYGLGLAGVAAMLGWFVGVAQARMPRGLRDLVAYGLSYAAQFDAYVFLLTDRYPDSDPQTAIGELPVRSDPIGLEVGGELARNRLTVFFRLILAIPHLIWLALWAIAALIAVVANWFVTLAGGISPASLHNFLAAYVRYQQHVYAYLFLIADPFPGFTGKVGSYPIEPRIAPPATQNRWTVGFRIVLAIPAVLINSAYGGLLLVVAVLGWFAALATGGMPLGMRNAGALAIRYAAQANGYYLLLTDAYPYSGPVATAGNEPSAAVPEPFAEPVL